MALAWAPRRRLRAGAAGAVVTAVALLAVAVLERTTNPRAQALLGVELVRGVPSDALVWVAAPRARLRQVMLAAAEPDLPQMAMHWDPASGDLYATNPETGAVTIMHTSFVNATTEHTNQPGPVVPINSGDPHTYFPGHEMSPRRVRRPYEGAGLDSVTESPQEATFRRHFKMFKKYLGTDGEDPYTAAYRIWAMHPSMSSGMEPEEDEEEEEDEGAAEEDEGAAAEDEGAAAEDDTGAAAEDGEGAEAQPAGEAAEER